MSQPIQPQQMYPQPDSDPAKKAGLLDIRFTRFLSLSLISVWWVVALILIALGVVFGVITGFTRMGEETTSGLLLIVGAPIGGIIMAVLTRLFLESVAVLFRIANNTSELAKRRQF